MGRHINKELSNIYLVQDESEALKIHVSQPDNLALVTQTTLSVDDTKSIIGILKERFPNIKVPKKDDICYATQNRQDAVKQLSLECEVVLVIGSKTSSNSNRLKELAEKCGTTSFLIDGKSDIDVELIKTASSIGITAGASAPEEIVQDVISFLYPLGYQSVRNLSENNETMTFKLPKELLD
jgi:4-hydroxy-3-methylbut-2-enyl diphosphate reductase